MNNLSGFWRTLELFPSLAAVADEWLALLRGEYNLVKPFLRPRKDRAISFPKIDGGLPYTVVEHGADDFVGVCQETGDTIKLTKSHLVVYELDRRRFGQILADSWGIDRRSGPEEWNGTTVHLGQFTSAAKICYAAFLTFPNESEDVYVLATRLIAEKRVPFIMFAPSRRWLRRVAETVMRVHGSVFVSLANTMMSPCVGQLKPVEALAIVLSRETIIVDVTKSRLEPETGRNVFRLEGDIWTLTFANKTALLRNSLGLNCIAHLISKKNCDIDAVVLRAVATKNIMVKPSAGIEALDQEAIEQYKAEHEDLVEQLEEAKEFNDIAKQEQIQERIDILARHVISVKGLRGRTRKTKDQVANARTSLTNAINRTIQLLHKHNSDLARHLDKSIRTGQSLRYSPENDVDWDM